MAPCSAVDDSPGSPHSVGGAAHRRCHDSTPARRRRDDVPVPWLRRRRRRLSDAAQLRGDRVLRLFRTIYTLAGGPGDGGRADGRLTQLTGRRSSSGCRAARPVVHDDVVGEDQARRRSRLCRLTYIKWADSIKAPLVDNSVETVEPSDPVGCAAIGDSPVPDTQIPRTRSTDRSTSQPGRRRRTRSCVSSTPCSARRPRSTARAGAPRSPSRRSRWLLPLPRRPRPTATGRAADANRLVRTEQGPPPDPIRSRP